MTSPDPVSSVPDSGQSVLTWEIAHRLRQRGLLIPVDANHEDTELADLAHRMAEAISTLDELDRKIRHMKRKSLTK
jgi:hypothetical protein